MASPPYNHNYGGSSVSPPYPSHAPLPQSKKRTSDALTGAPANKRRKNSILSTTSSIHPLRQTSFPPDGEFRGHGRSPSVDTMSLVSGSAVNVPQPKKRGRKPKNRGDDNASVAGGKAQTVVSAVSGKGGKNKNEAEEEEEDDGDNMAVTIVARTNEEKEKEKQHRAMLVGAFDPDQFNRYEVWRSSRLADGVVRRLVNQTLSQSVPVGVILAVKSVTKIWAGEIIERARKIQTQWLELAIKERTQRLALEEAKEKSQAKDQDAASDRTLPNTQEEPQADKEEDVQMNGTEDKEPEPEPEPVLVPTLLKDIPQDPPEPRYSAFGNKSAGDKSRSRPNLSYGDQAGHFLPPPKNEQERKIREELNRTKRGPLTPEHLREALRRLKMERAGGVGLLNLGRQQHPTGMEKFGIKMAGKRPFR